MSSRFENHRESENNNNNYESVKPDELSSLISTDSSSSSSDSSDISSPAGNGQLVDLNAKIGDNSKNSNHRLHRFMLEESGDQDKEDEEEFAVTPAHLLVEKTPEGFRRIKGQTLGPKYFGENEYHPNFVLGAHGDMVGTTPTPNCMSSTNSSSNGWKSWNTSNSMGVVKQDRATPGHFAHFEESAKYNAGYGYPPQPSHHASMSAQQQAPSNGSSNFSLPIELQVSNLDQTIDQKDMKKIITSMFKQHVMVLQVSVFFQSDGNMAACVRVPNVQEAQFAISKLHRTKIGFKRILISYNHNQTQNPALLRTKVVALLNEVPSKNLQLFKFREMFEKRYHASIGVSDLYKMKEVVTITEGSSGRMVQLNPYPSYSGYSSSSHIASLHQQSARQQLSNPYLESSTATPSIRNSTPNLEVLETPFCLKHAPKTGDDQGWAEKENGSTLPLINISLQTFSPNMRQIVKNHCGSVPLSTIVHCYEAEYESLIVDKEEGVPMEHLISCVKGIQIAQGVTGSKSVIATATSDEENLNSSHSSSTVSIPSMMSASSCTSTNNGYPIQHPSAPASFAMQHPHLSSNGSSGMGSISNGMSMMPPPQSGVNGGIVNPAPLAGQLALFSRELVDLLKSQSGCRMPFHKFIPSYHHHFGRQCRVADYGYTKLKELFEAVPHIIQIMGEGSRAMITLSHRAQLKRFTADLLRVLKCQPSKQVLLQEYPAVYEKITNRPFKISDYGVCDVEDLLQEISDTSVVLSGSGDDLAISIPKREQTLDEVERTHQFAQECIELLRHAPDCRLPFNKFIPSYHHHFGRQCRVADYGFSKLIELFEAVPGTIEVTEDAEGERLLQLTDSERMSVVADHIANLIKTSSGNFVNVKDLPELYRKNYGYLLRPEDFGQNSVLGLLAKLSSTIRVEGNDESDSTVRLIDRSYIKAFSNQVRNILIEQTDGKMPIEQFKAEFNKRYDVQVDIEKMLQDLPELIEIVKENKKEVVRTEKTKSPEKEDALEEINNNEETENKESIRLVPLQLCAFRIEELLKDTQGKLLCCELEAAFADKYKTALCPGKFGFHSINTLIQTGLTKFFSIRGRGVKKMICPAKDVPEAPKVFRLPLNHGNFESVETSSDGRISRASSYSESGRTSHSPSPFEVISKQSSSSSQSQAPIRFSTLRHEGLRIPSYNPRQHHPSQYHQQYQQQQQQYQPHVGYRQYPSSTSHHYAYPSSRDSTQVGTASGVPSYPPPPSSSRYPSSGYQYYEHLAQFGLYPSSKYSDRGAVANSKPVPTPKNSGLNPNPHHLPLSISPALGSPISAPGFPPVTSPFGDLKSPLNCENGSFWGMGGGGRSFGNNGSAGHFNFPQNGGTGRHFYQ